MVKLLYVDVARCTSKDTCDAWGENGEMLREMEYQVNGIWDLIKLLQAFARRIIRVETMRPLELDPSGLVIDRMFCQAKNIQLK